MRHTISPRGAGAGRGAGVLLCASVVLLVLGGPVPGTAQTTPTVAITWDAQAVWQAPSFPVTFTFSEAVAGLTGDSEDILLSTATALLTGANFRAHSATTYSIEVTPDAGAAFVNVSVRRNAAQAVTSGRGNAETGAVISLLPPLPAPNAPPDVLR